MSDLAFVQIPTLVTFLNTSRLPSGMRRLELSNKNCALFRLARGKRRLTSLGGRNPVKRPAEVLQAGNTLPERLGPSLADVDFSPYGIIHDKQKRTLQEGENLPDPIQVYEC